MSVHKWKEIIQHALPEGRYIHTLGVVDAAVRMSERHGGDKEKAALAAYLHDYAKPLPREQLLEILRKEEPNENFSSYGDTLLHAPAASYLLKQKFGIDDEDVLKSIYWHTTGHPEMSLLEKIIFVADNIEPGRSFPGIEELRSLADKDLDKAVFVASANTITYLVGTNRLIHPMTLAVYNAFHYQKKKNERRGV